MIFWEKLGIVGFLRKQGRAVQHLVKFYFSAGFSNKEITVIMAVKTIVKETQIVDVLKRVPQT